MSGCKQLTFWCGQDARRNDEDTGPNLFVLCTEVDTLLSSKLIVRSKNMVHSLFKSCVKFILGWYF